MLACTYVVKVRKYRKEIVVTSILPEKFPNFYPRLLITIIKCFYPLNRRYLEQKLVKIFRSFWSRIEDPKSSFEIFLHLQT